MLPNRKWIRLIFVTLIALASGPLAFFAQPEPASAGTQTCCIDRLEECEHKCAAPPYYCGIQQFLCHWNTCDAICECIPC